VPPTTAFDLTGRRIHWVSAALATVFVLFGLFFHYSQQKLLATITESKLAGVEGYSEAKAKEEVARMSSRTAALSTTIARLSAGQLENSQAFNLVKEGLATTLEPFMDYTEIAAIEVSDRSDRPYAAMWRGEGRLEFRADYAMPPAFREKHHLVVRTPATAGGAVQGFVTVFVDDRAISAQAAALKDGLHRGANAEIAMLSSHFNGTLLPQLGVLLVGIAFVIFASQAIARSYRVIDAHRNELSAFNTQLEHKVQARTRELERAAQKNLQINEDLRASQSELLLTVDALRRKDEDLRHLAFHDALTGLPNRALLLDRIEQSIEVAARQDERRGLMFIDLDRFKAINDTIGHDAGDALLKELAQRLKSSLRRSDTVARIGGDEFVVLLHHAPSSEHYATVAQKLIDVVCQPMDFGNTVLQVGASIGIACFPQDGATSFDLMKRADMAMYEVKTSGRGGFSFFQEALTSASVKRLQMEGELRLAIAHGELELHYQPKVSLDTNAIFGVEALVRWRHPERGLISPNDFIPLAEATGLIVPLGDWVLAEACRQSAAWKRTLGRSVKIAVNISARQMQRGNLVERVSALIAQHGLQASDLQVELTESVIMANPDDCARVLTALRRLGVVVAIDDFGTGYSSLAYLSRLPLDVLKIDRSFVAHAGQDENDAEIVKMIIALAQTLKLELIAEGVETSAQAAFLRASGCHMVQGYLYARPQPAAEVEGLLRQGSILPGQPALQAPAPSPAAALSAV
jgi:diguanylate cyclase (GGDEF)-like protein